MQNVLPVVLGQRELGEHIARARRKANLSQDDLARRIGVRSATVSRWERGVNRVPEHQLERIAEATHQPLSYFVQDGDGGQPAAEDLREEIAAIRQSLDQIIGLLRARGLLPDEPAQSGEQEE